MLPDRREASWKHRGAGRHGMRPLMEHRVLALPLRLALSGPLLLPPNEGVEPRRAPARLVKGQSLRRRRRRLPPTRAKPSGHFTYNALKNRDTLHNIKQ